MSNLLQKKLNSIKVSPFVKNTIRVKIPNSGVLNIGKYILNKYGSFLNKSTEISLLYVKSNFELESLSVCLNKRKAVSFPLDFANKLYCNNKNDDNKSSAIYKSKNKKTLFRYELLWNQLEMDYITVSDIKNTVMNISLKYKDVLNSDIAETYLFICKKDVFLSDETECFYFRNIKQFQQQKISFRKDSEEKKTINFIGYLNGMYLDNISDISSIKSLKISIDDKEFMNYDNVMLKMLTKKISDDCIFIDFKSKIDFIKYHCSVKISINTNKDQNLILRCITNNRLRYINNHCALCPKYH